MKSNPNKLVVWLLAARPKTLVAAVIPVLLGSALAQSADSILWTPAAICLLFAVLIQIGTNFANDYFDFVKGADTEDRLGPSRAVASGWIQPEAMKKAMILTLSAAFLIGLFLCLWGGWTLLWIGVISVMAAVAYTGGPFPLAYNGLGDVFVLVFFGLIATGFTYFVQAGSFVYIQFSGTSDVILWVVALQPGVLATNLLAVNNYRDEPLDRKANKRTLAVRFGRRFARSEIMLLNLTALLIPVVLLILGMKWTVLLPLLAIPLVLRQESVISRADLREEYDKALGLTAAVLVLQGILLSVGILLN